MKNEEIDFFGYGQRVGKSIYENAAKIKEDILKKYGVDAALQFDCGLSLVSARNNLTTMEQSIPKINDIINGHIQTNDNERNNSYFDQTGTSNKYDENGEYIDPMQR